jgi:hypothetical protein
MPIFESPDGGNTVYSRESGTDRRELIQLTIVELTMVDPCMNTLWNQSYGATFVEQLKPIPLYKMH